MGQTMAKNTLFIVFASLLKHLKFDAPTAHPLPNPSNCTYGFISMPEPFYANIKVIGSRGQAGPGEAKASRQG